MQRDLLLRTYPENRPLLPLLQTTEGKLFLLSGVALSSESINFLTSAQSLGLSQRQNLACVLQNLQLTPALWTQFFRQLLETLPQSDSRCPDLIVSNAQLNDEVLADLASSFRSFRVTNIYLGHNQLTSAGARVLFERNPQLKRADFTNNQIDSSFAALLVEAIQQGRFKLDYLNLSLNQLTDDDKAAICRALKQTRSVAVIILENNEEDQTQLMKRYGLDKRMVALTTCTFFGAFKDWVAKGIVVQHSKILEERLARVEQERAVTEFMQDAQNGLLPLKTLIFDFDVGGFNPLPNFMLTPVVLRLLQYCAKQGAIEIPTLNLKYAWHQNNPRISIDTLIEVLNDFTGLETLHIPSNLLTILEFKNLIDIISRHPTLRRLTLNDLHHPAAEANQRLQILRTLFERNTTLHTVGFNFSGAVGVPEGFIEAISHNHGICHMGGGLSLEPQIATLLERNKKLQKGTQVSKINAIRAVYQDQDVAELCPARQAAIQLPSLKAIALEQVKKPFLELHEFLEKENQRLSPPRNWLFRSGLKGRYDKASLYTKLQCKVDELLYGNPLLLTQEKAQELLKETALIAHHRRYSFWNTLGSVFNKKCKQAESWRRFHAAFNSNQENSALITLFDGKKRKSVAFFDDESIEHFTRSYNHYRKIQLNR